MGKTCIFDYLDYRSFLKSAFAELKENDPVYTYRHIASELGLGSIGHITWILQGKRNLTLKNADKFATLLKLNKKEYLYFKLLIPYTNTRKHAEKKNYFEKIARVQKSTQQKVTGEQFEYWNRWYYSALRELVAIHRISDDYKKAGRLLVPKISSAEAENALKLLESLNLIARDESGFFYRVDKVLDADVSWGTLAIRQYQMSMLELAKRGLESIPREERDFSTITMSISEEKFEEIRRLFNDFRQQLVTLARTDTSPQRIYQVGLQLFPLSIKQEENK